MRSNWTTTIRDPQSRRTAQQRSDAWRQTSAEVFTALTQALVNKMLTIEPPAGCPDALAKRLAKHNERADGFENRRDAWRERYVALPLKEAEASAKPKAVIEEREAALMEQFEVFADHRALLEARGALLSEVVSAMGEHEKAAADTLEQERTKANKALRKAGYAPEDDPQFKNNPAGIRIQFTHKVNAAAPVRDAQAALAQVKASIEATAGQLAGIAADVELVDALRYAAMGEAVGSL